MITATIALDTSTPTMIAAATMTTIRAPTTNLTSPGVSGPASYSGLAGLARHLRVAARTGATALRLARLRGGAACVVIGPAPAGSGSGTRLSPAAMSATSGSGASPAGGPGSGTATSVPAESGARPSGPR